MKRNLCVLITVLLLVPWLSAAKKPNIIFILADDLGYNELGSYGQTKIKTPYLDQMAKEGMRLTRHYSGSPVCAPSRCVLMTGKHPGHAHIRNNRELSKMVNGKKVRMEGQSPIPASELTLAEGLKKQGYVCGAFGKWGLGNPGSEGDALNQGFDRFFGYNCQRHAHSYFPDYLWDNDQRVELGNHPPIPGHAKLPENLDPEDPKNYERYKGKEYASDKIIDEVLTFIEGHREQPFFVYYPTLIPHLALHVPDEELEPYLKLGWEDPPHAARYTPHFTPRAAYAAMITRLDRYVGRIFALLKKLKIDDNTLVVFTSDNGPTYLGPMKDFFNSDGGLRGDKGQSYEGGLRVPAIVRWPGEITPGSESDVLSGFEDWWPTLVGLAGGSSDLDFLDGVNLIPMLKGHSVGPRKFLYREFAGYSGQQACWQGDWKAIRQNLTRGPQTLELYNLKTDPFESQNLASQYPEKISQFEELMSKQRVPSKVFPIKGLDQN